MKISAGLLGESPNRTLLISLCHFIDGTIHSQKDIDGKKIWVQNAIESRWLVQTGASADMDSSSLSCLSEAAYHAAIGQNG